MSISLSSLYSEWKLLKLCQTLQPHGLYSPWNSLGQNTGVGSLSLLQRIFLTQELNRGLLHCSQILYQLSYHGSPVFTAKDKHKQNIFKDNYNKYIFTFSYTGPPFPSSPTIPKTHTLFLYSHGLITFW